MPQLQLVMALGWTSDGMEMEMGRRERLKVKYSYFKQIRSAAIKRKVVTLPDPVLETVVKFVA